MEYFILFLISLRLLYWFLIFIRLAIYKPAFSLKNDLPEVSIVICVKDNLIQLKDHLNKILKQNYTRYEVVIVDDFSTDGLKQYIDELNHPLIKYFQVSQDRPGKKFALTEGVLASKYEWILQTDSDCAVASLDWIKWMVGARNSETKIVLGVSPLKPQGGMVSFLAAYESIYIAMQYLSYALVGKAYMGVGRNILFEKTAFLKARPYDDNTDLASGDDDFLVQKISTKNNTAICTEPNAFTYSSSPQHLNKYLQQKKRHVSTSPRYNALHQYSLGLFGFLHLAIYLSIVTGIVGKWILLKQAIGMILLMVGVITIIQIPIFVKMRQRYLISWIAIADVFLAGFYLYLTFGYLSNGLLDKRKQTTWN